MEDIARGVLEGIAIGGFATLIFNANLLAVKTLWRFNRLAIQTAYEMKLQPKTKVVGKVCKTLKNDTTFRFQLNLRGTQRFL